jgi:hypothetical protein
MLLAVFVLALVAALGITLLFLARTEQRMVRSDLRSKKAYYLAEAGQEDGRMSMFAAYGGDMGSGLTNYAGVNGMLDFDPAALQVTYDGDGAVTGLTGFGDDLPVRGLTAAGDGFYAAFVTNDPGEVVTSPTENNDRVMIYGVGAGDDRSVEIVQALVERTALPPIIPPATITILGPDPTFDGGTSDDKLYSGDDCSDPALSVPVVGVIGPTAETQAEAGVSKPGTYVSGANTGVDTVDDVDGVIEPDWKNCEYLHELAGKVKVKADVVGDATTPETDLGTPGSPKLVYIEGDYVIAGNFNGAGMLWVTGTLTWSGTSGWYGPIYVVGTGVFLRDGGGNSFTDGAILVANIAGADGTMWTDDDCAGPDGTPGTSDDGIDTGSYNNNGGGEHTTRFCKDAITAAHPPEPYAIKSFRQR